MVLSKVIGLCLICLCLASCSNRITVLNKGVGGNNSRDLLKRVEKDVLQEKPDLVVIISPLEWVADYCNKSTAIP